MTRKLNDYIDELSNSLASYGGKVLECSHCGHAVAVVSFDMKTFCEYDIVCEDCKKNKPLLGPNPFEWQKYNNPPYINPADKGWWQTPVTTTSPPNPETMAWSDGGYPPVTLMNTDYIKNNANFKDNYLYMEQQLQMQQNLQENV